MIIFLAGCPERIDEMLDPDLYEHVLFAFGDKGNENNFYQLIEKKKKETKNEDQS